MPGATVSPLWTEWATANPPDSKPKPESNVLASTNRSRAGVTASRRTASQAAGPSASSVSKQRRARAPAVIVVAPWTWFARCASITVRASNQVASASPIPATSSRTGARAMTEVSTSTRSGLRR